MRVQCLVCQSEHKHLIELGLVSRIPVRILSKRFGMSRDSIWGHRKSHMSGELVAALLTARRPTDIDLEELARTESEGLLAGLVHQRARLALLSELAFQEKAISPAASIEKAITANLALTSQLLGLIVQRHDVRSTSVLISADYLALRHAIITALKPFPEASRAVGTALAALEVQAAEVIKTSTKPLLLEAPPC